MAIPLRFVPATPESTQEIQKRLNESQLKHAKAILAAYELLGELHDRKVIETLRGALGAGDVIVSKLAMAANTEGSINIVRNLVSAARIFASVDPDLLHKFADEISTLKLESRSGRKRGIWTAFKMIASKDSLRVLAGSAAFMQAFGRALSAGKAQH